MKRNWMAKTIVSALTLGTVACMQGNPVEERAAAGKNTENEVAVSARTPIGSIEPVTKCSTLSQLRTLRTTGNYVLTKDIDASPTATTPFVPIGGTKTPFTGTFDGKNFTIKNLTIKGTWDNTGMFSWAVNAIIRNTRLTDVNVTGGRNTGAIAGYARNVDLTYSFVTGTVTGNLQGDSRLGMVFGLAGEYVRVSRCYATGSVKGWGQSVGGIIGRIYATGTHDPNPEEDFRARLYEVYADVAVDPSMPSGTGPVYAGGLAGHVVGGDFQNVHTKGAVTGRSAAGGILGYVVNDDPYSKPSILRGAMSRGVVTDNAVSQRAGTIGMSTGTFAWCGSFWDTGTDTGILNPNMPEPQCQTGLSSGKLKAPDPAPNNIDPYFFGMKIDQQMIDASSTDNVRQCNLGSGTDGDWGVGTCGATAIWALNSNTEYNTLLRIPNPGVQPK